MRLLFITQKIDRNDDLLGVFHEWVKKLALKFELVNVICLYKGEYDLPDNVKIYSLGKEEFPDYKKPNKLKYILKFYKYIWLLRNEYDSVFVHMNPEYVVLAGPLWKLLGKKVVLWYAHYLSSLKLRVAVFFTDKVVTAIKEAFPFNTKKLLVLQQGIDIDKFSQPSGDGFKSEDNRLKILFLGRISPVKNLEILIEALSILNRENHNFHLNIVGGPTDKDSDYFHKIKEKIKVLENEENVSFLGKVPNCKTPEIYNENDIFVNLTKTGSFDKTTLEAMASGSLVLVSNEAFGGIFDTRLKELLMFKEGNAVDLASKIEKLASLSFEEKNAIKKELRNIIVKNHSLDKLIDKLAYVLEE